MQQLRSWARRVRTDPARPAPALTDPSARADAAVLTPVLTPLRPTRPTAPFGPRRIRYEARDRLLVAGCSLGLSAGAAGLLWLLSWWLA